MKKEGSAGRPLPQNPFRVMVVDDSAVIRGFIARWLEEDSEISVVSTAGNGEIAVKSIVRSKAEVVVLDIEMPVMDGLTALPKLIEQVPDIKIVMASTLTERNADISLRAMTMGAADFIPKPGTNREVGGSDSFKRELVSKVRALAAARRRDRGEQLPSDRRYGAAVKSVPLAGSGVGDFSPRVASGEIELVRPSPIPPRILGVGASTGGPQALGKFLKDIAADIKIPVLVTQHMPATFTAMLAEHMSKASGLPASEGRDGDTLMPGHVYIAPGGFHMKVVSNGLHKKIKLTEDPPEHYCRPSVNPMFSSIATQYGTAALCVMLTGMGADGVEGAKQVVEKGGTLLAQDEASSIVWGMPGAVATAGICSSILPLDKMGNEATRLMSGGAK